MEFMFYLSIILLTPHNYLEWKPKILLFLRSRGLYQITMTTEVELDSAVEKIVFLISEIRLYFHCHSYLVKSSTSELKDIFWLPLQIVMRHEKYCRWVKHRFHLFCVLQSSVPAKIIWCIFCLVVHWIWYHVNVLKLHIIYLDKQWYTHLQRELEK